VLCSHAVGYIWNMCVQYTARQSQMETVTVLKRNYESSLS